MTGQHDREGITASQRLARITAGIDPPREPKMVAAEKRVSPIVAAVCEHCGCVSPRAVDTKDRACMFCGKVPKRDWFYVPGGLP